MIRFLLRLFFSSGRWVGPSLLWTTYMLILLPDPSPSPALQAATSTPGSVICAAWLTYNLLSFDDRDHAELLTAAIGSAGRARLVRTSASMGVMLVVTTLVAALQVATTHDLEAGMWMFVCLAASAVWGASTAALLAPPMIEAALARLLVLGLSLVSIVLAARSGLMKSIAAGELWSIPLLVTCVIGSYAIMLLVIALLLPQRTLRFSDHAVQ